jgi:hypothetical protein
MTRGRDHVRVLRYDRCLVRQRWAQLDASYTRLPYVYPYRLVLNPEAGAVLGCTLPAVYTYSGVPPNVPPSGLLSPNGAGYVAFDSQGVSRGAGD